MSVTYTEINEAAEAVRQAEAANALRVITAKFPGTCGVCSGRFEQGARIGWIKGGASLHVDCLAKAKATKPQTATVAAQVSKFPPTDEQQTIIDLVRTGESLAIEAGAGTGKTSTLLFVAHDLATLRPDATVQYVAFNKAIVLEGKSKFPRNTRCNTAHSLAMRAVGRKYEHRLNGPRQRSDEVARRLGIQGMTVQGGSGADFWEKPITPAALASIVLEAVRKFCQTADETPGREHVPYIDGIDDLAADGRRTYTNNRKVAAYLERFVRAAWADIESVDGQLRFEHDHYLKLWQLSGPRIDANVILFDEAQDANPVMVAIVAAQTHAQLIWVGDSQQQIYEFTGAVNALQTIPTRNRAFLTQSFRFGPAVAEQANRILATIDGAAIRLIGFDKIESRVEALDAADAILCRTNAAAVRSVLGALATGRTPHLVGGGKDIVSFAKAAARLMDGLPVDHPELACFKSWVEVEEYVEKDKQGADLKLLVSLIDEFGVDTIVDALENMPGEKDADVIVSTAHKAKGREWDTVSLADDFPQEPEKLNDGERRLLYVAVTRAKLVLDITAVAVLRDGTAPSPATDEIDLSAAIRAYHGEEA